ncbi:MAG: hypothetical protein BA872_03540 [Desulfobacterales bacterium C00003060]|nr:MAG: hypothetical protein BA861_09760 [Desulfobacterales bacterium S3730MH5]OEU80830.1 MAG: hypothetical protein BA872_03540 [Desulfobacterales bacterium C00003060]
MKRFSLVVIIIAVLAVAAYYGHKIFFPKPEIEVLKTAKVERGDIKAVLVETGIIKPQVGAEVKIGARATGVIESMKVKIGDRVEKGQLIALIDDRETVRAIEEQKAAMIRARNNLEQVKLTFPKKIEEAQADYDYQKIAYERELKLIEQEYTTQDEVDQTKSRNEAAEAKLRRLKDEFRTEVKVAEATVEEIEARLHRQEIRFTYTRIYAPIDGVVSDITAQEGETIVTGLQVANLVTVLDPGRLELWIYVDETDVGRVKVGQDVEYYVDAYPEKLFFGTVEEIYFQPVVKDNIVYYLAITKVKKEDTRILRQQMTAYVKIIYDERKNVLTAANAAIKFEGGGQIVYRVDGENQVKKVPVRIGARGEDKTEICSGVREGEVLATKIILPVSKGPH